MSDLVRSGSPQSSTSFVQLAACFASASSELSEEQSSSRAFSALSCCCLLTARDEVRLAARSEGGGEAGSGVASDTVSCATSGESLRSACGAPPPRPTPTSLAFSRDAGTEASKSELLSFAASSLVSEDPALPILSGEAAPKLP